jgi:hypothetical protein
VYCNLGCRFLPLIIDSELSLDSLDENEDVLH